MRHLDVLFDLAARYGAGIDVHLHDPSELGAWELELIVDRTRDTGLGGRVTVSHAYGFSQMDAASRDRLIERLAEAGVTPVTAAVYSFPVPPIKRLRAAGQPVRRQLGAVAHHVVGQEEIPGERGGGGPDLDRPRKSGE